MLGRIEFEALGKAQSLRLSTNNICRFEEKSGRKITDFVADLEDQRLSFVDVRHMLWAAMGSTKTQDQIGDIIDDLGLARTIELITLSLQGAFKSVIDAAGDEGNAQAAAE